jgi:predicted enzyme related to lactoylglutathione lyase
VPASNPQALEQFYTTLLGVPLARSLSEREHFHAPISNEGQFLWVSQRNDPEERISAVFAVDDLDSATNDLTNAGGETMGGPFEVPAPPLQARQHWARAGADADKPLGRISYFRDPEQNVISLLEITNPRAQRSFKVGQYEAKLAPEVLTAQKGAVQAGKALGHH